MIIFLGLMNFFVLMLDRKMTKKKEMEKERWKFFFVSFPFDRKLHWNNHEVTNSQAILAVLFFISVIIVCLWYLNWPFPFLGTFKDQNMFLICSYCVWLQQNVNRTFSKVRLIEVCVWVYSEIFGLVKNAKFCSSEYFESL